MIGAAALTPGQLAGRTLRMMREAHGLSVREVARNTSTSASHLSRIERGQACGSDDLQDRLCDFYGTTTARR
jgi:transcriptional regulator with XRE-family HTH domain